MTSKQSLARIRHAYVAVKGRDYIAVCLPYFDGPRAARAMVTPSRIYTLDLSLDRASGALVYGCWYGEALGASVHVLKASDVLSAALWGPGGWEWLASYAKPNIFEKGGAVDGPDWLPPAQLPDLDGSMRPRNPPL